MPTPNPILSLVFRPAPLPLPFCDVDDEEEFEVWVDEGGNIVDKLAGDGAEKDSPVGLLQFGPFWSSVLQHCHSWVVLL